ncbi:MAG: hypothetical protein PHC50_03930 [Candidatus Cloacimonetes bacterium]|nr:hypothetical protein [Candidatus Cloacimonadota bacterium]
MCINLLRCALRARFVKSGRKALRPYTPISLDIVLGFGISGQPPAIIHPSFFIAALAQPVSLRVLGKITLGKETRLNMEIKPQPP